MAAGSIISFPEPPPAISSQHCKAAHTWLCSSPQHFYAPLRSAAPGPLPVPKRVQFLIFSKQTLSSSFCALTLFSQLPSTEVQRKLIHTSSVACLLAAHRHPEWGASPFDLLFLHSGSSPVWSGGTSLDLQPLGLRFVPTFSRCSAP